jgi:DNA helicase-2/ATP-dependent DNA helicase PcrA
VLLDHPTNADALHNVGTDAYDFHRVDGNIGLGARLHHAADGTWPVHPLAERPSVGVGPSVDFPAPEAWSIAMDLLADLTPEQRDAVTHVDGPLLVLAGAGSGKTRVITRRIGHLLYQGVRDRNILAITFTNKAAAEMASRVELLVPGHKVWISTFHKFCARLLRIHGQAVGLRSGYVIYDTTDRLRLIREVMEQLEIDRTRLPAERVENIISRAKNDYIEPAAFQEHRATDMVNMQVAQIYTLYQKQLLERNAVDFDDLLLSAAILLRDNPELRAELDERYRYVLVDEYQDTNLVQYRLLRALSVDYPNLCATGDPDQSIYGWRGANVKNILMFEEDYPGTRVVRLEKNYRSTKHILAAANQLIRNNVHRKPKDLRTDNPQGAPVRVEQLASERVEASAIAREIRDAVQSGQRNYGDFAVFCRISALTRAFEAAFLAERVPYQVLSGFAFFERAEVKDMLAYLRLIVNPRDDESFQRAVASPPRGIGDTTIDRLQAGARQRGWPLLEMARHAREVAGLKPRQAASLAAFVRLIDDLAAERGNSVTELLQQVAERTGHLGLAEDDERRANIEELLTAAHQFDMLHEEGGLEQFLTDSSLSTDLDEFEECSKVSLMTLHAAKGLEFPVVYIVAVEQGILPHERSSDSKRELEEERRLLFVGMTRAQQDLTLTYVREREFRGSSRFVVPSLFLHELPRPEPAPRPREPERPRPMLTTAAELAGDAPPRSAAPDGFQLGMLVRHPAFGLGRVTRLNGYGAQRTATVQFTRGGDRSFVIAKSPLQPVGAG